MPLSLDYSIAFEKARMEQIVVQVWRDLCFTPVWSQDVPRGEISLLSDFVTPDMSTHPHSVQWWRQPLPDHKWA